jgi:hypothetical protein
MIVTTYGLSPVFVRTDVSGQACAKTALAGALEHRLPPDNEVDDFSVPQDHDGERPHLNPMPSGHDFYAWV